MELELLSAYNRAPYLSGPDKGYFNIIMKKSNGWSVGVTEEFHMIPVSLFPVSHSIGVVVVGCRACLMKSFLSILVMVSNY